ncbi:MAG: AAA family ATPase [Candidatus Latescibacteria bacterium]|nr:AAA family ATPase [Candidatus Latescibacterota bacterium]
MREILYLLNPHWGGNPLTVGVLRPHYLQPLLATLERRNVQMLIGSRRVGKTTLMFQAIQHLLTEQSIPANEVLCVSLESLHGIIVPPSYHFRCKKYLAHISDTYRTE